MSINPETQYPGKIKPSSADYPYGEARNITTPGDGTGTPWEAALLNDIFGFQQSLLSDAGVVPSGTPDKVGASQYMEALSKITFRIFDDIATMQADLSLQIGAYVKWIGKTSASDGKGAFGVVVAGATGATSDGYIDLTNGNQVEPAMGKFSIGYDTVRGRNFLQIYNWVDDLQVVSFADQTASGDAHVMKLPPDIRRDSHALLATAGTFGGENDIDFRTYLYSDYVLLRGKTTYQDESFQVLFDTKPSRNDSTKKDGSGGGGLSPADDVYAFDAAMIVPSNRTDTPVSFPALPVLFQQYVELARRTGGNVSFRFTPNVDDNTITEETSGNTLGKLEDDGVTLGNKKFHSVDVTDLQAGNGNHSFSDTLSLGSATPQLYRLAASGQYLSGTLRVTTIGSGPGGFGVRHIAFQSDGTTLTTQVIGVDNLVTQFHADLALNAGILDLTLLYDGGWGGSGRFSFTVEWDSRSA